MINSQVYFVFFWDAVYLFGCSN